MVASLARVDPPAIAADVFGGRLDLAVRYVEWLTGAGVERGLVGPRETARIWDRHVLNCACAAAVIAENCSVVDIGSGAGLPGLVLAIARPDLEITLVESMARRVTFLNDVVADLGLRTVTVRHSRVEDLRGSAVAADVVTARAVAPMDRLVGWAASVLGVGGQLVALKGRAVLEEVAQALPALRGAGIRSGKLVAVLPDSGGVGEPADGAGFQRGLATSERGHWDLESAGAFVPAGGTDDGRSRVAGQLLSEEAIGRALEDAAQLGLLAVFHRSAKTLPATQSGGLG